MGRYRVLPEVRAEGYRPHDLHAEQRVWVEKNCYIDIWIEVLHALGLEPTAVMPFTLTADFEGDNWTFSKPPHGDLRTLYGVDVQELNVWRPLIEHAVEHLGAGKLISTEADAFWLPDTSGTDYRSQHGKTTIVMNDLDVENQRLGYFHNAGYFILEGEDFRGLFRLDAPHDPNFLPLFAELIRTDRLLRRSPAELSSVSGRLLREHFAHRPSLNPVRRFGERFMQDFPQLVSGGLAHYHAWAFGTIRQLGAAFDVAAGYLRWQAQHDASDLLPAAARFDAIAQGNKALILKVARAVNAKRPFDAAPIFNDMSQAWDEGMGMLAGALHST
jgi:hypothetical protein